MRIYPTVEDRKTLTEWFGHARKIYNDALEHMKRNRVYKEFGADGLKSVFTSEKIRGEPNAYFAENPFLARLPASSRKYAIRELVQAFKINRKRQKNDPAHRFQLKYREKKGCQHIKVEACCVKRLQNGRIRLYPRNKQLSTAGFRAGANMVDAVEYDVIVQKDALGRYWLIAPFSVAAPENQGGAHSNRDCCAIDPGVRTFATVYDPGFGLYKIGDGAATRLFRLLLALDRLLARQAEWNQRASRSKRRAMPYRSRRRLQLAITRLRQRVKNLVTELHWKTADFLTKKYHTIVLPPFETRQMVSRRARKLKVKSVRQMLGLSHYAFRLRLQSKAVERGCFVHLLSEEYTSKTCTACGCINAGLGSAKVFRCPSCCICYDRDGGGARNIFLKNYEKQAAFGPLPR